MKNGFVLCKPNFTVGEKTVAPLGHFLRKFHAPISRNWDVRRNLNSKGSLQADNTYKQDIHLYLTQTSALYALKLDACTPILSGIFTC